MRRAMEKTSGMAGNDAFLVTAPQDVGYLSGFTGEDSYLLLSRRWCVLITDGRYAEQARSDCKDIEIHTRTGPITKAITEVLRGRNVRRVGIQGEHVTLAMHERLTDALGRKKLIPLSSVTAPLRVVKDSSEIRSIRKAIRIAEAAFCGLIGGVLVGRSERQIAAELDYRMRGLGADGAAFETIVAAGANGSRPHYRPGGRKVKRGEAVLLDWGAKAGGYCCDLTRVVFTGKISPKIAELYELVLSAQRAGIRAIRPGVRCSSPDAAARKVIEQAGYGRQFTHGTGHGVGRDIHEAPVLGRTDTTRLKAGMVVTVEPGIYLPGVGGVRIEDDILVTAGGRERLSSLPRSPDKMISR